MKPCNKTRALKCRWCGHDHDRDIFDSKSPCPKCVFGQMLKACENCGEWFKDNRSSGGGRPPKTCSTRCRVAKHRRVTKRGLQKEDNLRKEKE